MKLKKGYIMKELAGRYVVLPVGGEPEGFQGILPSRSQCLLLSL